jgi:hypothetical protein
MNTQEQYKNIRRLLIGHGALLIFYGGLIGFAFLFFLIGKIALWPIPGEINYQLPGTYDGWRMAHMEALVNGVIMWLTAALLPFIPLSAKNITRSAYGLIIVAWTFSIASLIDPIFPNSRGLAYTGSLTNNIAFFLFYLGVLLVMIIMGAIAYKSLKPQNSKDL